MKIKTCINNLMVTIWMYLTISEEVFSLFPFMILMSLDHQEDYLALKSPVILDQCDLQFFMPIKSFPYLDKNKSNSSLFWLGER